MDRTNVNLGGTEYVIVPRDEFDRLVALAKAPPLPKPDRKGDVPAIEYARASLARKLIRQRLDAGLSQKELARIAGVREETICRLEGGRNTPSVATVDRIETALRGKQKSGANRSRRVKASRSSRRG